ncbi:MAG: alpha/beta hydrolase [bacterium]|nr:alpha/beta hydrolase [bacterium]
MSNDSSSLADTEVHYLASEAVGDEFKLFVGHCPGEAAAKEPPVVLFLTDANGTFGSAIDIIRSMQLAQHLPSMVVVGIGYRRGGLADTLDLRTRDLTPTVDPAFVEFFPQQRETGGATNFLAFITEELKPWVRERLAVDPDRSVYFGHSFGGLFGVFTLLTKPETFERYAIGSPSLWWNAGTSFDLEAAYAEAHADLDAKAYFGIGALETQKGRHRESRNLPEEARARSNAIYIDMVDDMKRFVETLEARRYPSLRIEAEVFPDEFHVTVPTLNLSRGLRQLFDAPG